MKRVRYRFKSKEIKVIRARDVLRTPMHKLPKWVRDAHSKNIIFLSCDSSELLYYTYYGECFLSLKPEDWLISIPPLDSMPPGAWQITGYLNKNFRRKIEKF